MNIRKKKRKREKKERKKKTCFSKSPPFEEGNPSEEKFEEPGSGRIEDFGEFRLKEEKDLMAEKGCGSRVEEMGLERK